MGRQYEHSPTFAKIASIMKTNEVSKKEFVRLYLEHTSSMKKNKKSSLLGSRRVRARYMYKQLVEDGIIIPISE